MSTAQRWQGVGEGERGKKKRESGRKSGRKGFDANGERGGEEDEEG